MKHRIRAILSIVALLTSLLAVVPVTASGGDGPSPMPPNPEKIINALRERGVIPPGATQAQAQAIYRAYIQQKMGRGDERTNPVSTALLRRAEASGQPGMVGHQDQATLSSQDVSSVEVDYALTLLVEFAGTDGNNTGPLHNEMPPPAPEDNSTFWVADFSPAHYDTMLFDSSPGARSMSNYYLEQSGGVYTVDGAAYGWVQVDHSEWWYGADSGSDTDNLNGPVWRLVEDAVIGACDVPWADYDEQDLFDIDGDGNFDEPDGYVDHIQFIHAGAGQEAGGGAQGDDAIWSHSWWADAGTHGPGLGGVPTCDPNVWVGPYTMNPEDGTIGVFVHEFGHDLGLPDLYDTNYTGESSTGFWTLMSSGSWLGCPGEALGTCPSGMGAWEKWVLGWLDPIVVEPGELQNATLLPATAPGAADKVIQVNLPPYTYSLTINEPYSGLYEWYSGQGDELNNTLTREFDLSPGSVLEFQAWYDIETDWDYGYVEVSTDGGATWATVAGNITTDTDPNGNNPEGNGITGDSNGWVSASFDLSAYSGTVLLRFRYETDVYVTNPGWTIDDVTIGSFFDGAESGAGDWVADGWRISAGTDVFEAFQYYMAEWRTPVGFDVSMTSWYNFVEGNTVEFFEATPGMLLWYRNSRYNDNWVGDHPWAGMLLLVDANSDLIEADVYYHSTRKAIPLPFRSRIQLVDAAFGPYTSLEQPITSWFEAPTDDGYLPALPGVATFDDDVTYVDDSWSSWFDRGSSTLSGLIRNSISSVDTPTFGLEITVQGDSDLDEANITVDFGNFVP